MSRTDRGDSSVFSCAIARVCQRCHTGPPQPVMARRRRGPERPGAVRNGTRRPKIFLSDLLYSCLACAMKYRVFGMSSQIYPSPIRAVPKPAVAAARPGGRFRLHVAAAAVLLRLLIGLAGGPCGKSAPGGRASRFSCAIPDGRRVVRRHPVSEARVRLPVVAHRPPAGPCRDRARRDGPTRGRRIHES